MWIVHILSEKYTRPSDLEAFQLSEREMGVKTNTNLQFLHPEEAVVMYLGVRIALKGAEQVLPVSADRLEHTDLRLFNTR